MDRGGLCGESFGMKPRLIESSITAALGEVKDAPSEVVYLPEGIHTITPFVDGKPQEVTVNVSPEKGEAIAASLQASLAQRNTQNVRPWFDFEHKGGAASAIPTAFRYEDGKGIMAAVEWTASGLAAIQGRDFSYLSPTFLIDDNGVPSGFPERGPLAALVNEPAFREIPRIAAKDAASDPTTTTTNIMKLLLAKLAIDPAHENAESSAVSKVESMEMDMTAKKKRIEELEAQIVAIQKEYDASAAKVGTLEAAAADAKTAAHKAKIDAAVASGKIAPKDEDTKTQALALLEANEALGSKFLESLPAKDPSGKVIDAKFGDGTKIEASSSEILAAEIAAGR